MNKQEVLESTGCKEIVSLNDYLEEIGDVGREWFEDFKPEPYFSYDSDKYNDIDDMLAEEFERGTFHLTDMLNDRFEIQAGIDKDGSVEPIPIVYDNEKNNYLTLDEFAEVIESVLPSEIEITVQVNQSFSWEHGWDYDEEEITFMVDDIEMKESLNSVFNEVKKEAAPVLDKHKADRENTAKIDKTKQEIER